MRNQCLGLAQRMGLEPLEKVVRLRAPWKQLSPAILRIGNRWAMTPDSDAIAPPWPDVLIATGRHSVAASLLVRAMSPRTFRIQIQDPGIRPALFDLVVVPRHDRLRGANVLVSHGALHGLTPELLAAAAARDGAAFQHLPHPRIAVLIGGSNGAYRLEAEDMSRLADDLARLAQSGAGLMFTASRRTGAANEALLRARLAGLPAVMWDGSGANPYHAILGLADAVVVTCDSVNMVTEAAITGKPIHVVDLPGGSAKFSRFHQGMREAGLCRPFALPLQSWSYPQSDDCGLVAAEAWRRLREKRG